MERCRDERYAMGALPLLAKACYITLTCFQYCCALWWQVVHKGACLPPTSSSTTNRRSLRLKFGASQAM